jgi:PhnB protein
VGDKSTSTLPHTITPYLAVRDAVRAIEFYKKAFGATVSIRISEASGRVGHASLKFGDSQVFLSDEYPEIGVSSPQTVGGTTFALYLYVDDVDKVTGQAVAAGAQLLREVQDEPDGDRRGRLRDPFGHEWMVATRKEALSTEQLRERFAPAGYKVE